VIAVAVAAAAALSLSARASGPAFWTLASASDFLRGTSDGIFVSSAGIITAGPQLTSRLTTAPSQIWSLAEAPDGTLWAGTGGDGRVIRIRSGATAREETVFDAEETNVFALAAAGGRVYAATSPDGRVYAIDADGAAKPFFDPSEKYIWALAVDSSGRLWVGAGNPAVIYRVEASGASKIIYRPPATHVVSFALDREGRMLAGTESPGRLYRFDAADKPFVLLDSGLTELRAVAAAPGGEIFAAGIAKGDEAASAGGESTTVAATLASAAPASSTSTPASTPAKRAVLYRIDPSGTWEAIWETGDTIYDVAAQDDGGVLAATGPEGRLYKVDKNNQVYLLTGVDAKQITRFARNARGGLSAFATANPGRVVAVGTDTQSPASYLSPVRDTKSVASWGLVRWESAGTVVLHTRSGNTEKPDDSWSDWSGPYNAKAGETIKSPAARFLQWKAVLTRAPTATPAPPVASLTSVTIAYLARNSRPAVTSITVHPPGVVFQRPFSSEDGAIAGLDDAVADARRPPGDSGPPTPAPGRRMYQKGLQTLAWKADDDDGDHLNYSLQYRREGETAWHDLRKGLSDTIFVWDTTTVGDGRYVVRVQASDDPGNAADRALIGSRESEPIQVDNTPPAVTTEVVRQGNTARLIVRVHDAHSPVQKLEYSVSGGVWQIVYPADGLADSPDERYEISLANEAEAARIIVRATDALQNVTSVAAVK
jgi:sugar lactone lactonase YvrE